MRIVAHLEQKNAKEAFADKNLFCYGILLSELA